MAALSLDRENFVLHKLHSLTGIVPVGYYMAQHLLLNSFSLAGPDAFNGVINFFDSVPRYLLFLVELLLIWLPLAFHGVYGMLITGRAAPNYFFGSRYGWSQNRMYTFQRWTGVLLFFMLIVHVLFTTGDKYIHGTSANLMYSVWRDRLNGPFHLWLIFYILLVFFASYHLGYGIWNFCIRWGLSVSDRAQMRVQQFSFVAFILLTLLGWGALAGFLMPHKTDSTEQINATVPYSQHVAIR